MNMPVFAPPFMLNGLGSSGSFFLSIMNDIITSIYEISAQKVLVSMNHTSAFIPRSGAVTHTAPIRKIAT